MVNKNKIDDNDVKILKNNFKNLKIKLEISREHEKALKSYIGNNYLEVFNVIYRMINK